MNEIKQKTGTINHGIARYTDKDGIPRLAYRGDIVTMPESEYDRLAAQDVFGDARTPEVYQRQKQGKPTNPASPITTPIAGVDSAASARVALLNKQHGTGIADSIDDLSEQVDPVPSRPDELELLKSAPSPFDGLPDENDQPVKPIHVAPKADWINYAVSGAPEALRISLEQAQSMTKADLIREFGQR